MCEESQDSKPCKLAEGYRPSFDLCQCAMGNTSVARQVVWNNNKNEKNANMLGCPQKRMILAENIILLASLPTNPEFVMLSRLPLILFANTILIYFSTVLRFYKIQLERQSESVMEVIKLRDLFPQVTQTTEEKRTVQSKYF